MDSGEPFHTPASASPDHAEWATRLAAALTRLAARLDPIGALPAQPGTLVAALDQGVALVDDRGRVTCWNAALERMLGCTETDAHGRSLVEALPVLRQSEVARALDAVLTGRSLGWRTRVALSMTGGARVLQVTIVPDPCGAILLWMDLTERVHAECALRESEDRFARIAGGANDGLWEWDIRHDTAYFSARWATTVGLPASAIAGTPRDWFERIHPEDLVGLRVAIERHLAGETADVRHAHRLRHEDGSYRHVLCRAVSVPDATRRPSHLAGSLTDTTEQARTQEAIARAGLRDPLTGLGNRALFVEGLGRRLVEYAQHRGDRFAVLYLDLDRFKLVNDSLGHLVGDELLVAVSRRLESCLREGDVLARLGGDEFAILLNTLGDHTQANGIALRIQETLTAPFVIGSREVFTSASIGIAFSTRGYANPEEIMRDADTAMYHAKGRGKARHELFDADMHARALDRLSLESDLRTAVKTSDFQVHYQPIVTLDTGMCAGFEALVRWTRHGHTVSPATFVPMAEELGLVEVLGTWVLQEACRTFAHWRRHFPDSGLECITVNVSTQQLSQSSFLHVVEQAVERAGLLPEHLRLEITETTLMDTSALTAELLRDLRDFGVKIYLDDFGTGYSSLSHLHKLPVDALKIDRSFVRSLLLPDRPAIVESIMALARTLDTGVVAEGVESDVQARELQRLGCRHAQGYFFSVPLDRQAAEALLQANQPLGQAAGGPRETEDVVAGLDAHVARPQGREIAWPEDVPAPRSSGLDLVLGRREVAERPTTNADSATTADRGGRWRPADPDSSDRL
jgi:diguanylate cyclase (GGDEF)-like protein/PAS domain S-box-containing protein